MSSEGFLPDGSVVCVGCGCIHPGASRLMAQLRTDLANAERELRAKRSRISALQGDQVRKLTADTRYNDAVTVLRAWALLCAPKTKEVTSEARVKPVIARLRGGYTVAQLIDAARGYAAFPYVVQGQGRGAAGTPEQRHVKATMIYRDADMVDKGIALLKRIPKLTHEEAYGDLDRRGRALLAEAA